MNMCISQESCRDYWLPVLRDADARRSLEVFVEKSRRLQLSSSPPPEDPLLGAGNPTEPPPISKDPPLDVVDSTEPSNISIPPQVQEVKSGAPEPPNNGADDTSGNKKNESSP